MRLIIVSSLMCVWATRAAGQGCTVTEGLGTAVTQNGTTISSINFPSNYEPCVRAAITVTGPASVSFTDFTLEETFTQDDPPVDYFWIGPEAGLSTFEFAHTNAPANFSVADGVEVKMVFATNGFEEKAGFKFECTPSAATTASPTPAPPAVPVPGGCVVDSGLGDAVTQNGNTIKSIHYPDTYNKSLYATITVTGPVMVEFVDFDTELEHDSCLPPMDACFDYVWVDGVRYCGTSGPESFSLEEGESVSVGFVSDTYDEDAYKGFHMECTPIYRAGCRVESGLDIAVEQSLTSIKSIKYDTDYDNCVYATITVIGPTTVEFTDFELERVLPQSADDVLPDYLWIDPKSGLNRTEFGNGYTPMNFTVADNVEVKMVFSTSSSGTAKGFSFNCPQVLGPTPTTQSPTAAGASASPTSAPTTSTVPGSCVVEAGLGTAVSQENRDIMSVNYPQHYDNKVEASITVTGPLTVEFLDFETSKDAVCGDWDTCFDYLSVDGVRYCGTNGPSNFTLAEGQISYMTFRSDQQTGAKGFHLRCTSPVTFAPTQSPTSSPTSSSPTRAPSASPTTLAPTAAPIVPPAAPTSTSPTAAPSQAPTATSPTLQTASPTPGEVVYEYNRATRAGSPLSGLPTIWALLVLPAVFLWR